MDCFEYPIDSKTLLRKKIRIKKELLANSEGYPEKRIAVLGGSTTNEIVDQLELFLLHYGIRPTFYQSEYAQYWQDAMFGNEALDGFHPDVIYIHTNWRNIPKYINYEAESTILVNGFRQLEKDSIDVLFLGSSQMFRTVDSERLYSEYGVNAYNYGASGQSMSITPYYFYEALKTQTPKLIAVEVGCVYYKNSELTAKEIAWNYAPTSLTKEKVASLEQVLESKSKAYLHAFCPLLVYHDRWRILNESGKSENKYDIDYVLHPEKYNGMYPRGFVGLDITNKQDFDYQNSDTALKEIPEESKNAIDRIAEECRERNIRLLFFKSPAPIWTKGDSESVKQFMAERDLTYLDLNEHIDRISLNNDSDFSDAKHLNTSGAEKVTDYLAQIIPSYMA